MGVSVYEARDDGFAGGIDGFGSPKLLCDLSDLTNCDDLVALDGDSAILDDAMCAVHRHDSAPGDQQISRESRGPNWRFCDGRYINGRMFLGNY
jgi:hypothetical protein